MGRSLVHFQDRHRSSSAYPLILKTRVLERHCKPLLTTRETPLHFNLMKTLLIFGCLGLSIGGGHLWAIAINFHLPVVLSIVGAIATVSGGLLAGLIGASDEIEG